MSRRQFVLVLAAFGVAVFLVALVLVHGSPHQKVTGAKATDPGDPDSPTEPNTVQVECASAAAGPRLNGDGNKTDIGALEDAKDVHEDDGYTLQQEGIDADDVAATCDRIRTERVTHAGELGFLGLLLVGSAVLVSRGGQRKDGERSPRPPRPTRREREGGVL